MFAARLRTDKDFNRRLAYSFIPRSIGILKDIFRFISLEDLPRQMEIIIDDIAEVLSVADVKKILEQYYSNGKGDDPVLHFYETFLSVFDPATREMRGVYYTPEPVVSFIVRSIHQILKDKFTIADGLASKNVTLLDPAGGTLGFLAKAIETAVSEFESKYGKGAVTTLLKEQILQNYYAFELMMAPYAIGHMKMSLLLEELGYKMNDNERVKYYLTNTLEMQELEESKFPGMSSLSHESHEAGKVKKQVPILVILGNPPYSGHSSNTGEWISSEIKEYYKVDGKPLDEKNPKWLQDDYVKFIRFAQWKIDLAGKGVLGFITNHSYLDNPTFRGMRQSLMNSFDEIYIFDLHGNNLKKEKAPDGSKDENVFDIQQGVAIAFFVKNKNVKNKSVFHHELFGLRESKYEWLNRHDIKNVKWKKLKPKSDFYLFIPQNAKLIKKYQAFHKITEIFPLNNTGIISKRDKFVIGFTKKEILRRLKIFSDKSLTDEFVAKSLNLSLKDKDKWDLPAARKEFFDRYDFENYFTQIQYRPFDKKWIFYHPTLVARCVEKVMTHLLKENISLCVGRQSSVIGSDIYDIVYVSENIVDLNLFRRGGELVFPLYIYYERKEKRKTPIHQMLLFEPEANYGTRQPNINQELFEELNGKFQKEASPEEIFYYIYAILYSNIYRTKYIEFLKIDFPRIPFTNDYKLFIQLGKLGKELADLHLLKSEELNKTVSKFPESGSNKVNKPQYKNNKVWINDIQYFDGIRENVWEYKIGGYQVCEKWLKDRKGRVLSLDEIQTYCKIITALSNTLKLQKKIDKLYESVEKTV